MRVPFPAILVAAGLVAGACKSTTNVTVLPAPSSLESVTMNEAVVLYWADNAFASDAADFSIYRVYSASYNGACGTRWSLEGTTVAPEFLVGALTNGVTVCYHVTALSKDGGESDWSPERQDTPRPDARNVAVYAYTVNPGASGFRFWDDLNNDGIVQPSELGLVQSGTLNSIDFVVDRSTVDSSLWIIPVYSGTTMQQYGYVEDLTSIDFAPASGYAGDSLKAQPGYGYVFKMVEGSLVVHYGAVRVTHVGRQFLVLDWSLQTDPGNRELAPPRAMVTTSPR